jgi:hypothetical protein
MTSHGVKVAAFNLAEMKSKDADRRAAAAKEAVMEADCELARQWTQLKATADLVREASEAASSEALQLAVKMVQAEEELDESRRLSEAEPISTPSPAPDMDEKTTVMDIVTTLWPEAAEAIDREDFRAAAIAFRKAFIKLRPSNTDDAEPFTPHQMLLLELQLLAEVNSMSP